MKRLALMTAFAALSCMFPVAAEAATATGTRVFVEEGIQGLPDSYSLAVHYEGEPGEANDVTVTIAGKVVAFEDAGAEIEARGGCTSDGPSRVVCSPSGDDGLGHINVELGDGDDLVRIETDRDRSVRRILGGPGDDTLQGVSASERLFGGPGDDVVDGGPGSDAINGGGGRDELRGGEPTNDSDFDFIHDGERDGSAASDTIVVHPGQGQLDYGSRRRRVTVDLQAGVAGAAGERDTLSGISSVVGGNGPDIMLGTDGFDFFRGGAGADRLEGRGSRDLLYGQKGADRVFGGAGDDHMSEDSDNARDIQSCGRGEDWVTSSDKRDRLRPSCEEGAWLNNPRLTATDEINRITVQPELSRRRAVFRTTCAGSDGCSGRITLLTAGQRELLGRGPIEIRRPRSGRHDIVVRLNARGRQYLRRGGYVRVVIFSRDPCNGCTNPRSVKSGFTTFMKR